MTRTLFLDTGVLLAMVSPGDRRGPQGRAVLRQITQGRWSRVYTSDYIVAETLNYLRQKVPRTEVAEALLTLVFGQPGQPPIVKDIFRVHSARFAAALSRFRTRFDDGFSFTDCTTLILAQEERFDDLATFDGRFRGLVAVVDGS